MQDPLSILRQYWHYDHFRSPQEAIIGSVLAGRDTLTLLPTGAGKSLCYQVPALLLPGLTLVISPLVSLMNDQVRQLLDRGIAAAYIHSGMTYTEIAQLLDQALTGDLKLLYLSPERLQNGQFNDYLPRFTLSLIAVDEAHCISQWGHDFRPEYLQIASLRHLFPGTPVLALTASATEKVLQNISSSLQLQQPALFRNSFERRNLFYRLQQAEYKAGAVIAHFRSHSGCGIVYCRSRRKTEELALTLEQNGISAAAYHAGMPQDKRRNIQEAWMSGQHQVMVATSAFGMGIDKADVRSVVHLDLPEHMEAYYQETGRAGRDNEQAEVLAVFNPADISRLKESTALYFPPDPYLRLVYQSVCEYLQIPIGNQPDDFFDFDLHDFLGKFRLDPVPATHALRLLAQEELWTLSESLFRPATVHFSVGRQTLDGINAQYPDLALVITGLLRLYSGIFSYPTPFNLYGFARQLRLPAPDVERILLQLQHMNILEYKAPREGPQLHFHHYRVDSRHLNINHKRINALRKAHQERVEVMIRYLQNTGECRNKLLMQYFSEAAGDRCEHCDVCVPAAAPDQKKLRQLITAYLQEQQKAQPQTLVQALNLPADMILNTIRLLLEEQVLSRDASGYIIFTSRG